MSSSTLPDANAIAKAEGQAQRTGFEPALYLDAIQEHPRNLRHEAIADDAMVQSIREHGLLVPIVVAPVDARPDRFELIDGHRRMDGLRKAGHTTAPAVIRYDLVNDADQILAMLGTQDHRADLSPIEEAEGYDLLSELGLTIKDIATKTGRSESTITARRKLTTLTATAQANVHTGQLTLEDALALAELPATEQRRLEKWSGNAADFRHQIRRAQEVQRIREREEARAKDLRAAGVPEIKWPKNLQHHESLQYDPHGMVRLWQTRLGAASDHDGCLAFTRETGEHKRVLLVCTEPANHDQVAALPGHTPIDTTTAIYGDLIGTPDSEPDQVDVDLAAPRATTSGQELTATDHAVARSLRVEAVSRAMHAGGILSRHIDDVLLERILHAVLPPFYEAWEPDLPAVLDRVVPGAILGVSFDDTYLERVTRNDASANLRDLLLVLLCGAESWLEFDGNDAMRARYSGLLEALGHDLSTADHAFLDAVDDQAEGTSE